MSDALAGAVPEQAAGWLSFPLDDGAVGALAACLVGWLTADPALRVRTRAGLVATVRERWSWDGVARGVIAAARGRIWTVWKGREGWRGACRGAPRHPLVRIVFRALMRPVTASITARAPAAGSPRRRRLPACAGGLLLALAVATSGCSVKGGENANLIVGKQAFVAKCGSCHTLARADTKGIVGPNLDEAFRASIAEGLERNTIRGVVEDQVRVPEPRRRDAGQASCSGATLTDIAAYVAQSADRPGPDTGLLASAVDAPGAGKPAVEKAGKLEIDANPTGQLAYTATKATATPGAVTITMANMSGVSHNIAVEPGTGGANPTTARCSGRAASSPRAAPRSRSR